MEVRRREIQNYVTANDRVPFLEWLNSLKDVKGKAKIKERLKRVRLGNLGDYRSLGEGVFELRINYGPGYRVYFGQVGEIIVLLLCGGDKSSQEKDIRKAQEYWIDYRSQDNA